MSDGANTERRPNRLRWSGAAGITAPIGFTVSAVTHSLGRPDHDLVTHPVSALAAGPTGWVQDLTFLLTGLLLAVFAWGLHRGVRARAGVDWAGLLLAVFAAGLVGAGVFPATDAAGAFTEDRVPHVVAGLIAFSTPGLAGLALARRLGRDRLWQGLSRYARITGVALLLLFAGGAVLVRPPSAPLHEGLGLFQWLFLAVWFPLIAVLGTRLLVAADAAARAGESGLASVGDRMAQ